MSDTPRCDSCDHTLAYHPQGENCWFAVTRTRAGSLIGCPCAAWVEPPPPRQPLRLIPPRTQADDDRRAGRRSWL